LFLPGVIALRHGETRREGPVALFPCPFCNQRVLYAQPPPRSDADILSGFHPGSE
jgi:hypothetical protein